MKQGTPGTIQCRKEGALESDNKVHAFSLQSVVFQTHTPGLKIKSFVFIHFINEGQMFSRLDHWAL